MPTSPASDEPRDEAVESNPIDRPTGRGDSDEPEESVDIASLRGKLSRTQNRYRRALADLDNYRKRVEHEGDRRAAEARHALLGDWLAAVDSVDRALQLEPDDPGLTAVREQMEAILAQNGVTRLGAVGEPFDPQRHEAVAVQPTDVAPDYTVFDVARSGFGYGDGSVLRPAQVVVVRHPVDEN